MMPLDHVGSGPCEGPPVSRDFARLRAFGADARLTTARGAVPAHALRDGDRLRTSSGDFAEITWIDRLELDTGFLRSVPSLKPVFLGAGDLGDAPNRNVILSPEQLVWTPSAGDGGGFRRAAELTRHPDLYRHRDIAVTYFSILCDTPVVVEAEGLLIPLIP